MPAAVTLAKNWPGDEANTSPNSSPHLHARSLPSSMVYKLQLYITSLHCNDSHRGLIVHLTM